MKSGLDHAKVLLEKAENDIKIAEIGLEHGAPTDTIAFHLQQAAEKTLKALLAFRSIVYPKTHDLDDLFDLLPKELVGVLSFRERVIGWTSYESICATTSRAILTERRCGEHYRLPKTCALQSCA
jgi:HEPN domain-containing protein